MTNREKIISAIEKAKKQSEENAQDSIIVPFKEADMIISLLKEQEPKSVELHTNVYGTKFYFCPKCKRELFHTRNLNFCEKCGQAVKWE